MQAQTPQSCSGLFTIEPSRVYNAGDDETIFQFKITQTGAQNALSHWGFEFDVCVGTEAAFEASAVAQTSTNGTTWSNITTDFGTDASQDCLTGDVIKFNQAMTETVRYYRLVVEGDVNIEIGLAYIKFGNACCVQDLNFGSCCPSLTVNDPADQEVCAGETTATVTFTGDIEGTVFTWTNNNTSIGLAASGTGNIASFTAVNTGTTDQVATITVTPTKDNCEGPSQSFTITVHPLPVVDAGSYGPVCSDDADITLTGTPEGGVWSGTGVTGNTFDPSAGTQTLTYTFEDVNGCEGSDQVTITVTQRVVVDAGSYGPVCNDAADITLTGTPAGGTWSGTGVTGNIFDPSVGTQTLTYTVSGDCGGSDQVTITVNSCVVFQGCTPGYWKIHPSAWCNYQTYSSFFYAVFGGVTNIRGLSNTLTLLQALNLKGGGYKALARTAAAAILSSCHSNVDYPYTTQQVKDAVVSMFNTGTAVLGGVTYTTVEALKNELDRANNLGCPLNRQNYQSSSVLDETASTSIISKLKVSAYPNPYTDIVRFVIESPISGEANLQISNTLGQKIAVVYKGRFNANTSQVFEYKIPTPAPQAVIYTLTIGSERIVGKLMKANKQ